MTSRPSGHTPQQTIGARLLAFQLIRALAANDFRRSRDLDGYVVSATGRMRIALDYMRDYFSGADVRRDVAPMVAALSEVTVAALTLLNGPDRVSEWLTIQADTVSKVIAAAGNERSPDPTVVAAASHIATRLGEAEDDERDSAVRADILGLVTGWVRDEHAAADSWDLLLAAAWLAAWVTAEALGHDQKAINEYLDEHSRALAARHQAVTG
ncbi:hypothetical protein [Streptomyces sp. NPDC002172]